MFRDALPLVRRARHFSARGCSYAVSFTLLVSHACDRYDHQTVAFGTPGSNGDVVRIISHSTVGHERVLNGLLP